jgi:phosphohistidine phosphatase
MRRLILFRHGKSEATPLTGGDRNRKLMDRGREESARTAAWLNQAGFTPQLVLVSPALRTQQTWEAMKAELPAAPCETRDSLYLGEMEELLAEVESDAAGAETVMIVGHNPGLQDLAIKLATDAGADDEQVDRLTDGFPTASACVLAMDGARPTALEAIYEPPRQNESKPRWLYLGGGEA